MKRINYFFFLVLMVSACTNRLNIEPEQAISTDRALSDNQGVRTALIGTYDRLTQLPGEVILFSEMLADSENLIWTGPTTEIIQFLFKTLAVNNNTLRNFWIDSYRTINQANTVLDAVAVVDEIDREAVAAELRFIRALVYFDLVNMYAKPWTAGNPELNLGVPIISTPAEQSLKNPEVPRNTVTEVYQFLIDDLLFAKANLPAQNTVFANSYAASALLSRVYLMQEKFDLATIEADRVISSGQFDLLTDFGQVFNQSENSKEDIFAIQITSQDGFNLLSNLYTGQLEGGIGEIGITDVHLTRYEMGDQRANLFYFDQQSSTLRSSKWRVRASRDGNVTIIRLAEMYLTRAEGRFRTGDAAGALEDINIIRNRAGLPSLTNIDLDIILNERFLELVFEGHQYRDTKRNRRQFGSLPFDAPSLIYPIPQREMDVNKALVQNEGY